MNVCQKQKIEKENEQGGTIDGKSFGKSHVKLITVEVSPNKHYQVNL